MAKLIENLVNNRLLSLLTHCSSKVVCVWIESVLHWTTGSLIEAIMRMHDHLVLVRHLSLFIDSLEDVDVGVIFQIHCLFLIFDS